LSETRFRPPRVRERPRLSVKPRLLGRELPLIGDMKTPAMLNNNNDHQIFMLDIPWDVLVSSKYFGVISPGELLEIT